MNTTLNDLLKMKEEFDRRIEKEGKNILKATFSDFFSSHPEIRSIVWTQYTPYFNDGEACVFSINDFEFILDMDSALVSDDVKKLYEHVADEYDGNYAYGEADARPIFRTLAGKHHYDKEQLKSLRLESRKLTDAEKKLVQDCNELESTCFKIKDLLSVAFGDHVVITATSKGFDVSEFGHD